MFPELLAVQNVTFLSVTITSHVDIDLDFPDPLPRFWTQMTLFLVVTFCCTSENITQFEMTPFFLAHLANSSSCVFWVTLLCKILRMRIYGKIITFTSRNLKCDLQSYSRPTVGKFELTTVFKAFAAEL